MSYKWPGIPNGDYSFDHGRTIWNKIINYLRRLSEKLDADIVDATADRRGMMTAADKAALDAAPVTYALRAGTVLSDPLTRTSPDGKVFGLAVGDPAVSDYTEVVDVGFNHANRDGALLGLRSSSHATQPGYFGLTARDAINTSILEGTPAGSLKWRGNQVITIVDTASATKAGVMSAADKVLLDSIPDTYVIKSSTLSASNRITRTSAGGHICYALSGTDTGANAEIADFGWDYANKDGAGIGFRSSSHNDPGMFYLYAQNSTDLSVLIGRPSGELIWDGYSVITARDIFVGATSSTDGSVGLVPAPTAGDQFKCLLGKGEWDYPTFINTTTGSANTSRPVWFSYQYENKRPVYNTNFQYNPATNDLTVGTINGFSLGASVPANAVFTDTVYIHPVTSGNKHVPSGGSNYDSLIWSSDGTAAWGYPVRIDTASGSTNSDRHVFFAYHGDDNRVAYNDNFKYNPATKNLAVEKINGYAITNVTTVPITFSSSVNAESAIAHCERIGRLVFFTFRVSFKNATATWNGNAIMSGLPKRYASSPNDYYYGGCVADNLPLDGYTAPPSADSGIIYYVGRSVSVPANKPIGGWGCYIAAD